jgi:hypothetical protein
MHGGRLAYYICGEGVVPESPASPVYGQPAGATLPARMPGLRFGRMFGRTQHTYRPEEEERVVRKLVQLGLRMTERVDSAPTKPEENDSDIPSGYTYLGQFIAHEITFHNTGDLLQTDLRPENLRTPEIDLDSLYGGAGGPKDNPRLYETDGASLRLGRTRYNPNTDVLSKTFMNDLPRGTEAGPEKACIGDPRNDENLTLAQTHVAFIAFHNRVVKDLWNKHPHYPAPKVFELAREQVIRHYQWIILYDFLPRIVRADVLDCVMNHGLRWFKGDGADGLFMPLEFSAAAFRIGHSMVRAAYEWNPYHRTDMPGVGPLPLEELFNQTGFLRGRVHPGGSGQSQPGGFPAAAAPKVGLDGRDALRSVWIIDWRHFYDFSPIGAVKKVKPFNMAAKLDTAFGLRLDSVEGFFSEKVEKMQRAITVRNLLRGFYLGLPTGEEVAEWMGETPLTRKELAGRRQADVPHHEDALDHPVFWGKTPLWYYILKEAELVGKNGAGQPCNRLGPVGGRIVAETLVGLIRNSHHSILKGEDWRPTQYGRPTGGPKGVKFEMIDLLHAAGVVDPIAAHLRKLMPSSNLNEEEEKQGAAGVG